jgi:uncharacterized repeat protein (TIGR01451 family)
MARGTRAAIRAGTAVVVATLALAGFAGSALARDDGKVTLCHRVGGPQYVAITVAPDAAVKGHGKHHPLDIIPAFTYSAHGDVMQFPGQNLTDEGVAILGNGCVAPTGGGEPTPVEEVTLCHRTKAGLYREQAVSTKLALEQHAEHARDIIPAFAYTGASGAGSFPGLNLTEAGVAILANGCVDPDVEVPPTPGTPQVALAKVGVDANGGSLMPGDVVQFTIVATNGGSGAANRVVVRDAIPAGTTYVSGSATTTSGTIAVRSSASGGWVVARIGEGATQRLGGTLPAGAAETIAFSVRVDEGLPNGAVVLNRGRVSFVDPGTGDRDRSASNVVELPITLLQVIPVPPIIDVPPSPVSPGVPPSIDVIAPPGAPALNVCVVLELPRTGVGLGVTRETCVQGLLPGVMKTIQPRIPVRAAGQCLRLVIFSSSIGRSSSEQVRRICVREVAPEVVTG